MGPIRRRILIAACLLGATAPLAAQVDHYDVRAVIDPPSAALRAESTVSFTAEAHTPAVEYWLNRGLSLDTVFATVPVRAVVRDTSRRGGMRWAGEAEPVRIVFAEPVRPGEAVALTFRYQGGIVPDRWRANLLTEEWFELAMYCAWFPLAQDDARFTYAVEARLPSDYRLTGLGTVSVRPEPGRSVYGVAQTTPVNDLVVAGSRDLRTEVVEHRGRRIALSHVDLSPARLERIAADAVDALDRFSGWFGPSDLETLEFLFVPRPSGGGYARPGFVVMQLDADSDVAGADFLRYLGHEAAHLWWAGAPYDGWEDWLNESFAEYGSLMLLRARLGGVELERRIRAYRDAAAETPPIRGLDRGDEQAFATLYRKGPVLLHELEQRLGRERFLSFLRALRRERISSTERLLDVLARVGTPADRDWLDATLDRPGCPPPQSPAPPGESRLLPPDDR